MRKIVLLVLMLMTGHLWAETLYVDDRLRVGVRSKPASNEAPLTVVTTGTALEVLERQGNHVKIRTPNGTEGWVNDVYVTGDKPARLRIKDLEADHARLQEELHEMEAGRTELGKENKRLRAQISGFKKENGILHGQLGKLYEESADESEGLHWLIYPAAMIALFLLGIYLGVRWQRQRVAQRLGGLEL